ncbi:MAG: DUF1071 domain-containing protein [Enterococcus casseliflavus]|nr:DUF1071 domain-containing protein [Enterococcus casseliflavus]
MTIKEIVPFEELYNRDLTNAVKKNVQKYKDKQGQPQEYTLEYLSWSYGWREMKRIDPEASEKVHEFPMFDNQFRMIEGVTVPYLKTPQGFFVRNTVTLQGKAETEWLPIVENAKYPLSNPNSFQINTSNKRCFVKALAKHGIGLYIYAGEDLPEDISKPELIAEEQVGYLEEILKVVSLSTETDLEILVANIRENTQIQTPFEQLNKNEYGTILNYANRLKLEAEKVHKAKQREQAAPTKKETQSFTWGK